MKSTAKIFYGLTIFLVVMALIYLFAVKYVEDAGYHTGIEWAGGTALVVSALMTLMLGAYFHFTEARQDVLPEDWEDAEIEDGAGTYGFFSTSSIWPIAMSGSILVLGLGIIYMHYWLIVLGAVLLIFTTFKLNLQYGIPKESH
ncbi:MAG: cytochrome c oxidase subunit 4 [Corynebacterium glucuronolyticum]|nr:cytochrome c oxidase subunit 4 [Corynebacterium glucuronolyticum]MDD7587389.1 cytochrome c oxidase subunit 4 [Mycobacteriaceae bacterium]MDY5834098.1 cytochrome c oxidase subunit 4 [Corynebacterium glucuronolyticum]